MKKIIALMFVLKVFFSFGQQVTVLDKEDNLPIPFVHFISTKGSLMGTSNLKGYVSFDELIDNDTLVAQHLSYQGIKIPVNNFKVLDTIFIEKRVQHLSEVVVSPKSNFSVTVLRGYFRSYEINDDIPKFYTDGLAEYYIMGNKIRMKLLDYRAYKNEGLIKQERKRTNSIVMRLATIPRIDDNSIRDIIKTKKYNTKEVSMDISKILKGSTIVGGIKRKVDSDKIILNMDLIKPNTSKSKTLFNYTSSILNNEITEVYSNDISTENILEIKQYRKILFKHKKDTKFIKLEGLGFRSIERIVGVSHVTVINWVKKYGKDLKTLHLNEKKHIKAVEVDELWSYVDLKKTSYGFGLLWTEKVNGCWVLQSGTGSK